MASISSPAPPNLTFTSPNFHSFIKKPFFHPPSSTSRKFSHSTLCRCSNDSSDVNPVNFRWDSAIQDIFKNAVKRFYSFVNRNPEDTANDENDAVSYLEEDWDWDRWKKHFEQVDEHERLVSLLKMQLNEAVVREDYEEAARLKVAIAAGFGKDTVGRVISHLNRAVMEERYVDAAFLRDNAGAGLVGWWAGLPSDTKDPYGIIIRITAEHGRYVARSFSPRQLANTSAGVPLFEIFLTVNKKGEYKQQAVYLKRRSLFQNSSMISPKTSGVTSPLGTLDSGEDKTDLFVISTEDGADEAEDEGIDDEDDDADDGSDEGEGLTTGFQNVLQDMIPGAKVKVVKVSAPGKVDKDFISKMIEQIIDEEDEEKDAEVEHIEVDDEIKNGSDQERDQIEMDADSGVIDSDRRRGEIAVKVVVGGLVQKLSSSVPALESLRVPATLVKKERKTFSFSIEKDMNQQDTSLKTKGLMDRKAKVRDQRMADEIMFDLAKFIGREKIPLEVLKDVGELINLTLSQVQNHQPLSGSTNFHRIETTASSDPLKGLYIGTHGLYSSEVIQLKRKFGQWQGDSGTKESSLQFYEYVEAVKLTGDAYVPAGQVAFRAKVGKRYQLPHNGIIPEELGVVARYKGQGRLAEPGFRNPRWVDGELVILDGKYIKGGPVVGFVYWAPEYHFLVFFNRLSLQS